MSWFSDLAGKAESILNNLDEQTGAALRNHNVVKKKVDNPGAGSPDPPWERPGRRRPIPRNLAKKIAPIPDNRSVSSTGRKPSPHRQPIEQSPVVKLNPDLSRNGSVKSKKSPSRKPSTNYNLNHPPKTLVDDIKDKKTQDHDVMDHVKCKQRRRSLPVDLELLNNDEWAYKTQNLEVENELLKNELTVMNGEMTQAMDRLRRMEDGNHVDRTDAAKTRVKLETADLLNEKANVENQTLSSQINQLKQKLDDITNNELRVYKDQATTLQVQVDILKDRNSDLEQRCKEHLDTIEEKNTAQIKLENELRHSQSTISDLQNNLQKATDECRRLERDWEAYKLRVKNMLVAKDNEIKALQEGLHHTEDTKVLLEQIGNLKDERDELSDTIATIRGECIDMKSYVEQAEAKQAAAERVVAALRDALRDERAARNKAEAQYLTASKELKHFQIETGQTITSLRTALRDKETELHHFRESSASRTSNCNSSALNVADYDNHETIENNKIQHLTQTLVQRQTKLDSLLAENNILKIQLEKLDSKYKTEISSLRANYSHSVVNLQDGDCRPRSRVYAPTSSMSALSLRIGVMMKRYPVIRIFCITYMVCLHFWVLTVLFTSTPDNFSSRPVKS